MVQSEDGRSDSQVLQTIMAATRRLWVPWLRMLLRRGVHYTALLPFLKDFFLQAAAQELRSHGQNVTASSLSVSSGVHRKDVRLWLQGAAVAMTPDTLSLASQVWTYWLHSPELPDGLPRRGEVQSFEWLVRQFSQDVHPHTLLQEMQRLGLVRLVLGDEEDQVLRLGDAFIPPPGSEESWAMFADSLADHLQTGLNNLETDGQPQLHRPHLHLEQSVFAGPLSQDSVELLEQWSRNHWKQFQDELIEQAQQRWQQDQLLPDSERQQRFRLGIYCYHGMLSEDASE